MVLQRLKGLVSRQDKPNATKFYSSSSLGGFSGGSIGRNNTYTIDKFGAALATISTPYAMAVVNKLVSEFEAAGYRIVNADGETLVSGDDFGNDPLFTSLKRYADDNGGFSLFGYWALHKFQTGEAYIELVRNDYGYPVGLDTLNSLYVTKYTINNADVSAYYYGLGDMYITFNPDNVVLDRFRTNIFTEVDGTPPLLANLSSGTLSALRSAGYAMLSYFDNDGLPRAFITPANGDDWSSEHQQNSIRRALERNKGSGNKYKTQIFPYEMNVSVFDPPDLTQWMSGTDTAEKYIFSAYGIPPSQAGLTFDTRYQVSDQDVTVFNRQMTAYFETIAQTVNTNIMPFFGYPDGVRFEFDLSKYETVDDSAVNRANSGYLNGALSLNEYRTTMGYAEIEGADDVFMLPASGFTVTREQLISGDIPQAEISPAPFQSVDTTDQQYRIKDDLKRWHKVARRKRERAIEFTSTAIPEWLQDHIRTALKGGVDVDDLFNSIKSDITEEQVATLTSLWEKLGLTRLVEGVEDVQQTSDNETN